MLMFFEDPESDPIHLLLYSAQNGDIDGIKRAIKLGAEIFFSEGMMGMSVLHFAASCHGPKGTETVRWVLNQGVPWNHTNLGNHFPFQVAELCGNKESATVLKEWALNAEYEKYYRPHVDVEHIEKRYQMHSMRHVTDQENEAYCRTPILFTNPNGAPEDEVALVTIPDGCGVMMEWERPIMEKTAKLLLDGMPTKGLRVLNIGFGIGMIDTYFQDAHPAEHFIIEGHSTCLGWMRHKGWDKRPGVRILEGRWQDILCNTQYKPQNPEGVTDEPFDIGKFDIVYFDTFMEGYRGHMDFIKHVPRLLRGPTSRFSFFNGHGVKAEELYKVYMEVERLHHNDVGLNTEWFMAEVDKSAIWYDICDREQKLDDRYTKQSIPICALAPTIPRTLVPNSGWNSSPEQVI